MDSIRFGRALGEGTRAVAKALLKAADAAAAPGPLPDAAGSDARAQNTTAAQRKSGSVAATLREARAGGERLAGAGRAAGRQALAPVARTATVLWLEVTGLFFGIFAAGMAFELWHRRSDFSTTGTARTEAWLLLALVVMFTWFTCSSFLRATRRGRR